MGKVFRPERQLAFGLFFIIYCMQNTKAIPYIIHGIWYELVSHRKNEMKMIY